MKNEEKNKSLNLRIERLYKKANYTIGKLYIDGVYFCDTLEDTDRGLYQKMGLPETVKRKIQGQTAIGTGVYKVVTDVVSPKFSKMDFYKKNANGGRLPRLLDVIGFDGILFHVGKNETHTDGCILVGRNKSVGSLSDSEEVFTELYKKLDGCVHTLEIV